MIETMANAFDGLAIARKRIAEEAEAQTGFLDLGGLGLTALLPELFRLRHLRELNLGAGIRREDRTYHEAYKLWDEDARRNGIATEKFETLRELPVLTRLSVRA